MPELPEVETTVRLLRPRLLTRRITGFRTAWRRSLSPALPAFRRAVVDRTVTEVRRRAKWVLIDLDDDTHVMIHLRMSGRLVWAADCNFSRRRWRHIRSAFTFDGGDELWFDDARKFGRLIHTENLTEATAHLGVEPLERGFTARRLQALLRGRRRRLKPLLLDQSLVAGLGNIYVDEALFRAGLHPLTSTDALDEDDCRRLTNAIKQVLRKAIRMNGTSIDWIYPGGTMQNHLSVYGRAHEQCRRCGNELQSLRVAQRGTCICPTCQPPR